MNKYLVLLFLISSSCNTGKLKVVSSLPKCLKEGSAIETLVHSDLLWTIEDSGNKNNIYGLNVNGKIIRDIELKNSNNIDWEDLTSDKEGNLYIGDFGNNSKTTNVFTIYKVSHFSTKKTQAERINFFLPKKTKPKDFEAFFILNEHFYLFSKENKSSTLFKVPNEVGMHQAVLVKKFNLNAKSLKITSADISDNGKTIVLLSHNKLWKITNFKNDAFFEGTIKELKFEHSSQKEGICFKNENTVYITDERHKNEGGNLYEFSLN